MSGIFVAIWIGITSSWAAAANWSPGVVPPGDPFDGVIGIRFDATANRTVHNDLNPADPFSSRQLTLRFTANGYLIDGLPYPYCSLYADFAGGTSEVALDNPGGSSAFCTPLILNVASTGVLVVSGSLPDVPIQKQNTGTVRLTHASSFTSGTEIDDGTLVVNGNRPASPITMLGGRLGGSGTVGSITATAGDIAPGESPGILTSGNVSMVAGVTFSPELAGTVVGTGYDQLRVVGSVALGGATLNPTLSFSPSLASDTTFRILDNDGGDAVAGTFAGLAEGATFAIGARTARISYVGGSGNDITLTILGIAAATITVTPASLSALTVGVATNQTLTSSGGLAPYTYSVVGASLPAGLTLSAGGVLSGTPTTAGAYSVTIRSTDANSDSGNTTYSGTIAASVPTMPAPVLLITALALLAIARHQAMRRSTRHFR